MQQALPAIPLTEAVRPLLATATYGRLLRGYQTAGSTNTLASEWAAAGAPEGSLVVAEYQTAGRGRHGRRWQATAGQNLTFSIILRPSLAPQQLGLMTLAASVAVADAITPFVAPLAPCIKWPNDILLDRRKCCGMLLESAGTGREGAPPDYVILGVGINVNQADFAPEIAPQATSLLLASGRFVPRAHLLADVLLRLETRCRSLTLKAGAQSVRQAYEHRLTSLGQSTEFSLSGSGERVHGVVEGITEAGALRLKTQGGVRILYAGEVTSRPVTA